ncbi:MAG: hypothetical protein ACKO34_01190 [Vampirovibrionales bacterium]
MFTLTPKSRFKGCFQVAITLLMLLAVAPLPSWANQPPSKPQATSSLKGKPQRLPAKKPVKQAPSLDADFPFPVPSDLPDGVTRRDQLML